VKKFKWLEEEPAQRRWSSSSSSQFSRKTASGKPPVFQNPMVKDLFADTTNTMEKSLMKLEKKEDAQLFLQVLRQQIGANGKLEVQLRPYSAQPAQLLRQI
jgi:hypothetical protein